jgi:hypothetical protein
VTRDLSWIFLAVCAIGTVAATWSRNRIPVVGSMVIAGGLRIAFAALTSQSYTPHDVRSYFLTTAQLLLQGKDPVHDMAGRQWNFLELMPAIHAIELKTGLAWVYAVKIAPIAADLVLVWLVARFAGSDGRTRALQYAVNPLSLLVVSLHGQVEPIALALALTGVLLIKKGRPVLGGVFLGAAVAAKTWPVVILIAVLPLRNLPKLVRIIAGSAIVPVVCLLAGVLLLDTQLLPDLRHILGYSSFVSLWTWSGTYIALGHENQVGYGSDLGRPGTALVLVGVVVVLLLLRRREPEVRALAVLCAVLICSSGFGVQYLLWVLPLMMAISGPIRVGYVLGAGAWAAVFYLSPIPGAAAFAGFLRGMSWLPFGLLVAALIEQVRIRPAQDAESSDLGGTEETAVPPGPTDELATGVNSDAPTPRRGFVESEG